MLILNQRTEQAATDTVALGYDERKRSRLKVTLSSGREAGIFLETRRAPARWRQAGRRRRSRRGGNPRRTGIADRSLRRYAAAFRPCRLSPG
ncbi:hypothetical protein [Propionivibrio sp.]|uniref:urease accessory protein UreE N-terminal domain-containing protein n=1 Tax=Propionivibrio sp. TaxID=2212460 RepID=UPI00345BCEC9